MSLIIAYALISSIKSNGVLYLVEGLGFEKTMIILAVWAMFSIADALWVRTLIGR